MASDQEESHTKALFLQVMLLRISNRESIPRKLFKALRQMQVMLLCISNRESIPRKLLKALRQMQVMLLCISNIEQEESHTKEHFASGGQIDAS